MKMVSIPDEVHEKITDEIDAARINGVEPIPTYGSIIKEMAEKRYKNKK
jgi:hypothetical protein